MKKVKTIGWTRRGSQSIRFGQGDGSPSVANQPRGVGNGEFEP